MRIRSFAKIAIMIVPLLFVSDVWLFASDENQCNVPSAVGDAKNNPELLFKTLMPVARMTCSTEACDASEYVFEMLMGKAGSHYRSGDSRAVWAANRGLLGYFEEMIKQYPELAVDKMRLVNRIKELDASKEGEHIVRGDLSRPALDARSHFNFFDEALKIADGNVFRATTLLGMVGHDDITNTESISNLFAGNSLGEIDRLAKDKPAYGRFMRVRERFAKASDQCRKTFEKFGMGDSSASDRQMCLGAGGTFNYHLIFGFYLGCELAKRGFESGRVSTVMGKALSVASNGFFDREFEKKKIEGGQYCTDSLCTDIPTLVGYFYKTVTMSNFLSNDARILMEKGYRKPFMAADKLITKPVGWSDRRFEEAVANLDYRLMHVEYSVELQRAGAEQGAALCRDYKADVTPKEISDDARVLYQMGYLSPNIAREDMKRRPAGWSDQRVRAAVESLTAGLGQNPDRYDYVRGVVGKQDPAANPLDAFVSRAFDQDADLFSLYDEMKGKVKARDFLKTALVRVENSNLKLAYEVIAFLAEEEGPSVMKDLVDLYRTATSDKARNEVVGWFFVVDQRLSEKSSPMKEHLKQYLSEAEMLEVQMRILKSGKHSGLNWAVQGVMKSDNPKRIEAIPDLVRIVTDHPDGGDYVYGYFTMVEAVGALGEIGKKRPDVVVPALMQVFENKKAYELKNKAALTLAEFGESARPALPKMRAYLGELEAFSDRFYYSQIKAAIEKIEVEKEESLLSNGEVAFRLVDRDGNTPKISLFGGSPFFAKQINRVQRMLSPDDIKDLISIDEKVTLTFEGLILTPVAGDGDKVQITLMGRTREFQLMNHPISRKALESGSEITLEFPAQKSKAGNSVLAKSKLSFHYDKSTGALVVTKAEGEMTVSILVYGDSTDRGAVESLKGVRDPELPRKKYKEKID